MPNYKTKDLTVPAKTLLYTLSFDRSGGYMVSKIRLGYRCPYSETSVDLHLALRFQATGSEANATGEYKYYGGSAEIHDVKFEEAIAAGKLMEKILRHHDKVRRDTSSPAEWNLTLIDLGALHVEDDRRLSRYVPRDQFRGVEWKAWRDDWHTLGSVSGCTLAAFARDEDEARSQMIIDVKERKGECRYSTPSDEWFENWKGKGFPVIQLNTYWDWRKPVDWTDLWYVDGKPRAKVEAAEAAPAEEVSAT